MRELQKHNYTGYNECNGEQQQEALERSGSGVMFDDDFVDALAQRLVQRMHDDLSRNARTRRSETSATVRLLLAVFSVLAFIAVIAIVLKTASLVWWMVLAILGMAGLIFVLINVAFQSSLR